MLSQAVSVLGLDYRVMIRRTFYEAYWMSLPKVGYIVLLFNKKT